MVYILNLYWEMRNKQDKISNEMELENHDENDEIYEFDENDPDNKEIIEAAEDELMMEDAADSDPDTCNISEAFFTWPESVVKSFLGH